MKRRDFIKTTAIAAPVLSMFPADLSAILRESAMGNLERRALEST